MFETVINNTKLSITKEQFEQLIESLITKTIDCCKLAVKDADIDLQEIETIVKDGTLQIKFKHHENWGDHNYGPIEVYVTAKSLSALANAGSGSIKLDGSLTGNSVNISLSGSGNVTAAVKGGDFHAAISGSGSIDVKGSADKTNVSMLMV